MHRAGRVYKEISRQGFNMTCRRRDPDRDRSMHLFEKKDPGDTYRGKLVV